MYMEQHSISQHLNNVINLGIVQKMVDSCKLCVFDYIYKLCYVIKLINYKTLTYPSCSWRVHCPWFGCCPQTWLDCCLQNCNLLDPVALPKYWH